MAHVGGEDRSRLAQAERRQRILSDVSRVLLDCVGPDEIEPLRRIVHQVTEAMATDWCAFALVQPDGTLKNVATYHPDPRQRELEKKLDALVTPRRWDAGPAELNPFLKGRPIVTEEITDEMLRAAVPSQEAFHALKEIGLTSAIVVPMFDRSEPLGRLLLASTGKGRRYSKDDLDFAYSLAGRAALAVRNARLVAELARQRDIQSQERSEADRRFAELRAVFDSDPNGIALFDARGLLRMASLHLEEIFGIPLRAMYGQRFDEIYRQKLAQVVSQDREAMLERVRGIFARFFRAANATTRNYSGLGIGLFVAHEIVHRHGGWFEVRSELAKGSTFAFYLPLSQRLGSVDDLRARVLLVDDDPEMLEATGQVLRDWGYTVDEACDAQTALTLARNSKPDLMIIDLMMPVIDGWTLIRRLREENVAADVPLVVFSADRDVPDKARNVDADAALRKPFELEELQEVVERLLPSKPAA